LVSLTSFHSDKLLTITSGYSLGPSIWRLHDGFTC
jgi:hypothetical protein